MSLEAIAVELLRCALAWERDACLVGNVTALDVARLAASHLTACLVCGAEPWVSIDCLVCQALTVSLEEKPPPRPDGATVQPGPLEPVLARLAALEDRVQRAELDLDALRERLRAAEERA